MPTGSIQVYASVAGQAAPLAGVQVAVLDEPVTVAHLTTDEAGAAEATNLTAPNASYSLQETNTTVPLCRLPPAGRCQRLAEPDFGRRAGV